jgi:WD40 repeat protein
MIWDAITGARILAWQAHERPVTALLSVDHQHLVSGSSSGQLRVLFYA